MDEPTLRRKLLLVEALHEGATTEGERTAAAEARERLVRRMRKLGLVRQAGVHAAFRHAADLGPDEDLADPLVEENPELPDVEDLLTVLAAWRLGLRSAADVGSWASELCDRLLLPCCNVSDPRAARVEVLLQLAAMRRQPLVEADIPAIETFLQAEPGEAAWQDWFAWLADVDWRARRRG